MFNKLLNLFCYNMATLDDKLLGEKLHYYCSSSEDEGDDDEDDGDKVGNKFVFVVDQSYIQNRLLNL